MRQNWKKIFDQFQYQYALVLQLINLLYDLTKCWPIWCHVGWENNFFRDSFLLSFETNCIGKMIFRRQQRQKPIFYRIMNRKTSPCFFMEFHFWSNRVVLKRECEKMKRNFSIKFSSTFQIMICRHKFNV